MPREWSALGCSSRTLVARSSVEACVDMYQLPDELVLQVLQYLTPKELATCQSLSHRFLRLARDPVLWKEACYDSSYAEYSRTRWLQETATTNRERETIDRPRCRHNWDPGYPGEQIDYYDEYMHRNLDINLVWKTMPSHRANLETRELTGLSLLKRDDARSHAVCAVDDGSIVLYDLCSQSLSNRTVGHSKPGLLTPDASTPVISQQWMTKSTAIEVVSVDNSSQRGYFAVDRLLHEVDLSRLSLISSRSLDGPISALSSPISQGTLLVGTSNIVSLYDSREHRYSPGDTHCRLDGDRIILPEAGPSSILLAPDDDTIWVAGRFKSLLQYSLRFFPRLHSSDFSGAHISCLTSYPFPHVSWEEDLALSPSTPLSVLAMRKSMPGYTIVGAGSYRGKGSLELYTRSSECSLDESYVNRQSASSSKLLSVAIHGSKIVYSDGNAQLTWMSRNGYSFQRSHKIGAETSRKTLANAEENPLYGLWDTAERRLADSSDIVQKIIPYHGFETISGRRPENLMLWSGDGRLGFLGFGSIDAFQADEYYDALETQAQTAADKAHHDAERQYGLAMRRALQRNADEVRFMRGLGMRGP